MPRLRELVVSFEAVLPQLAKSLPIRYWYP